MFSCPDGAMLPLLRPLLPPLLLPQPPLPPALLPRPAVLLPLRESAVDSQPAELPVWKLLVCTSRRSGTTCRRDALVFC